MTGEERHTIIKEGGRVRAASLRAVLDALPDGVYTIPSPKRATNKTRKQGNYLHVLFTVAAQMLNDAGFGDGTPWTKDKVKAYCKKEGLYPQEELVMPGGVVVSIPVETRALDDLETSATIDRVIDHFREEHRIALPPPNAQVELNITSDETTAH